MPPAETRREPTLPLPARPFVPGGDTPRPPEPDLGGWRDETLCRHGADLFDHGAYWEAHVVWEALWLRCAGAERDAVQGLIQLAASRLKTEPHLEAAGARLRQRARTRLDRAVAAGLTELHGLELRTWRELASEPGRRGGSARPAAPALASR